MRVNSSGSDDSSPDEGEEKVEEEDEDEDEDDDDEDARTVIYKSPFSSPGIRYIFKQKTTIILRFFFRSSFISFCESNNDPPPIQSKVYTTSSL